MRDTYIESYAVWLARCTTADECEACIHHATASGATAQELDKIAVKANRLNLAAEYGG